MAGDFLQNFFDVYTRQIWAVYKGDRFWVRRGTHRALVRADGLSGPNSIFFTLIDGNLPPGTLMGNMDVHWTKITD